MKHMSVLILSSLLLTACGTTHYRSDHSQSGQQNSRYLSTMSASFFSPPPSRERYAAIQENEHKYTTDQPISTFSIDVDTAAYANVRRFITRGSLPPIDAVRTEELVNYFNYHYPIPERASQPFHIATEIGPTPWNSGSYLLHIGLKAYEPRLDERPAKNLVFLIDVSGSMQSENKLELLKKSLRLLVKQLTVQDRVAIVVYAGASGVVLESTAGHQHGKILKALRRLKAGGSTNGGEGIQRAYALARENFIEGGINRVLLATDGDFNVGVSNIGALKRIISEEKRHGIQLTALGFGKGNYNDHLMESLSNSGDGNAAYIDTLKEAQKVLVHDLNSTMQTVAHDTKIQIEFNPNVVSSYRLIGYENRMLKQDDFKDDRVDAGDVGAGHSVTAIYEIRLTEKRRYSVEAPEDELFEDEVAFLKLRYKRPNENHSQELKHAINKNTIKTALAATSTNYRFSAAVAAFGQLLRQSTYTSNYSYNEALKLAQNSRGADEFGYRSEFIQLVDLAEDLN